MNNQRRKQFEKLNTKIEEIKETAAALLEEEQDAFDNMPESFQEGEKGERAQSAIDALEALDYSLEEAIDHINTAIE